MRENFINKLAIENEHEYKVALPSNIFKTLLDWKEEKVIKSTHIPFVYSYLFLTTYMYRYGKYSNVMLKTSDIKEILGYAHNYKPIDYIIKKDGVLDSYGLTANTNDFPIGYEYVDGELNIMTLSQFDDEYVVHFKETMNVTNRQSVKVPLFGFERDAEGYNFDMEGTFFSSEHTVLSDIRVFDFCMSNKDLGIEAFYLYSYLQHMNNFYDGYDANHIRIGKELGISKNTIQKYRNELRKYNMLYLSHNMEYFKPGMNKELMKVSTNYINEFEEFNSNGQEYNRFLTKTEKEVTGTQNMTISKIIVAEKVVFEQPKVTVDIAIENLPF